MRSRFLNRLFPGWFQVISVVSSLASDNFWKVLGGLDGCKQFKFVPRFSKYVGALIKKVRVSRGVPRKFSE